MSAMRVKLVFCMLAALWVYAFWPTIIVMVDAYLHSGYDYQGLIIIPLSLILIWYKRSALHRIAPSYNKYGLFLLLFFCIVWLFAVITNLVLLQQVAVITAFLSMFLMVFGKKISSILSWPLLCLFLLLPIGYKFYSNIQEFFSWVLVESLSITNIEVYWEKNQVQIGDKIYLMSDVLYSFQHLMLFLTFGIAYAFIQAKKWYQRLLVTASFIVAPLLCIFIALFSLSNIERWIDFKPLKNLEVINACWFLTALGIIAAIIFGKWIKNQSESQNKFNDIDWRSDSFNLKARWFAILLACSTLLIVPIAAKAIKNNSHYSNGEILLATTGKINSWAGPTNVKSINNNSKSLEYNKDKQLVTISIIHNNNPQLYDSSKWTKIRESIHHVNLTNSSIPITELILKNNNQSKIIWSVYYVNGHLTNNLIMNQILEKLYSLSKNGAEVGVISLSTNTTTDLGSARKILETFLIDMENSKAATWLP